MTPPFARAVTTLLLLLGSLVAFPAGAAISIQTSVGARKVEIGQPFQVQIVAVGSPSDPPPSDPELPVPAGIEVRGPSVGTYVQGDLMSGRMSKGLQATWVLVARRAGKLRIGPATVDVGGKRERGDTVVIEVVPQGALPPAPRRFDPFSFDPFGGMPFPRGFPPSPFDEPETPDEPPPVPEELRVEQAPDPVAFLRAVVTPKNPVVGEQVRLRIYAYGGRGPFSGGNATGPSRADFLAYTPPDQGLDEPPVRVKIGEADFIAKKAFEIALFPLHSGELTIGPMTVTFSGGRGYRSATPLVRQSEPVVLKVEEPPLRGRPAGYKLGDVGELTLSARVDPLRITAGDGVSVVAKLSGTGNIPSSLIVPQQRGVEWAEPSIVDEVGWKDSVVQGFRVFTYVVKLSEPGRIDLGELTLPYFDPKRHAYSVARTALGKVQVDPNPAKTAQTPSADPSALGGSNTAALPAPRTTLAAFARPAAPFTDGFGFWALLLGAPFAVALTGTGIGLARRMSERMKSRRTSPERLAQDALREADEAARAGRAIETAGAVERALFRAIEAGTGLKARAFLRGELESALADAGVPKATLENALSLLDACESLRFTEGASEKAPQSLAEKARTVAAELARKRRRKS